MPHSAPDPDAAPVSSHDTSALSEPDGTAAPPDAATHDASAHDATPDAPDTSPAPDDSAASPDMLDRAERILGHRFACADLLAESLTHASCTADRINSNERMEFLGDAILGMVVCEFLFENFPELLEGEMTKIKSTVVSRRVCAKVSNTIGLTDMLSMGKGMTTRAEVPSSVAAAVFESVIAALYLDGGMAPARAFVLRHVEPFIAEAAESTHQSNYKSVLQQFAQKHLPSNPQYIMLDEKGPDHAKAFEVAAEIAGKRFPGCWANTKKEAEQKAARAALKHLGLATTDDQGNVHMLDPAAAATLAKNLDFASEA